MDPSYQQMAVYSESDYVYNNNTPLDPNYNMYWDYNYSNNTYTDPNQDYQPTQYMDSYLPCQEDVMTSWDIPSPIDNPENDSIQFLGNDNQSCTFSSSSMSFDQAYSPLSSQSSGGFSDTIEDTMLHDKLNTKKRIKGPLRKVHQRQAANVRERKRMRTINDAFEHLRQRVPQAQEDKKTSKVDTLKLAVKYITDLTDVLKSCGETNFPGLRKGKCNKKVVINYSTPEFNPMTGDFLMGHSLSWVDLKETKLTADNKMKTKLWVPHTPTREDLKAIEADGGGLH